MKKLVLLVVSFLMANILFADPFGLEMGMTLEEIKKKCGSSNVECIDGDGYKIKPPKPSFYFDHLYGAFVDDTFGLYALSGVTKPTSYSYCLALLNTIAERIEAHYGKAQEERKLKDITPTPIFMTFNPDTIIAYYWKLPECKKLEKEKVSEVFIYIDELTQDVGAVMIRYRFNNFDDAMEDKSPF